MHAAHPPSCLHHQEVVNAWDDGIGRLVQAGVNGTILLANLGGVKGLSVSMMKTRK